MSLRMLPGRVTGHPALAGTLGSCPPLREDTEQPQKDLGYRGAPQGACGLVVLAPGQWTLKGQLKRSPLETPLAWSPGDPPAQGGPSPWCRGTCPPKPAPRASYAELAAWGPPPPWLSPGTGVGLSARERCGTPGMAQPHIFGLSAERWDRCSGRGRATGVAPRHQGSWEGPGRASTGTLLPYLCSCQSVIACLCS